MAFGSPGFPPRRPVLAQGAIALLCFFLRRKKCHADLLALQDLGNQRRHPHVPGIKGEVNGSRACCGSHAGTHARS